MSLLVQKYGGTSVGTVERIRHVAAKIGAARRAGNEVVVVVSAMAGETNRLVALAHEISEMPDEREKDVLLASGEQVSIALLTLALKEVGQPARSFLGHQVRIETDNAYGKARIRNIDSRKIVQSLQAGEVVVLCRLQGVDEDDISRRSGVAGRIPARLPWRRSSMPRLARSIPTSKVFSPRTRGSVRTRKN
jgi:aspartate kinase